MEQTPLLSSTRLPARSSVLIIDPDVDLRQTLRELLEFEGYAALEAEHPDDGLKMLIASDAPLVVLVGNAASEDLSVPPFFTNVALLGQTATRHAYIYLTTVLSTISPELSALLDQRQAQILEKPCELPFLLTAVANAARAL